MAPNTCSNRTHGETESPNSNGTTNDPVRQPVQGPDVLAAFVEQIASLIGVNHHKNKNVGYNGKEDGCTFEKFNLKQPPIFEGQRGAIAAENWLCLIKKLIEVMNCSDEQKVRYATFKLTAEAERWWVVKKEHMQQQIEEGALIRWEDFKKEFLDRFFSQSIRLAKAQEFMDLLEGSMNVEQYATKFIELSLFAPYLIMTEELKAMKFEKGLYPRILNYVVDSS
ncbi:uncharacterized protein LOC133852534 [Alnus glutinosa]|uniref:uncharacterized protein LOC133852534 n=1 Tax=Alnus glutinosa TaxID=3517 RepID=UPI002D78318A|nr:uncharacterized protein LOC133852534 [Alnus glutinosa]